jgi:hypothetical protein
MESETVGVLLFARVRLDAAAAHQLADSASHTEDGNPLAAEKSLAGAEAPTDRRALGTAERGKVIGHASVMITAYFFNSPADLATAY